MYLIHLYEGEDLQWPFRVSGQKAVAIPLAYYDVILVSNSPHKVTRQSVTPLSTSDRDIEAGPSSGSMAAGSTRASGGSEADSLHLFSPDRLKMSPSMMTAAAQLLIWSTHTLLDCPNKSPTENSRSIQ